MNTGQDPPQTNTGQDSTANEAADKTSLERKSSHFIAQEDELPIKIIGPYDEEILPEDIVIPPDGGWGWVVVFAAFMSNLIVDGTIFSFGLLMNAIVNNEEDENQRNYIAKQLAWVSGVLAGFYMGTGPFVSALANAVGFRITAITGSFVSAFGVGMAGYFCREGDVDIDALFLFYGFIGGIGMCLLYVPSVITVGYYFEKKRALATGIAVCGSGIGTFVFAPVITTLVDKFNWQTTILFQAGFMLSTVFVVALYRPLKPIKHIMKTGETARVSTVLVVPSYTSVVVKVKNAGGSTVNTSATTTGPDHKVKVEDPDKNTQSAQATTVEVNDPSTLELYQRENRHSMNSVKSLNQTASLTPGVHVTKRFRESAPTIPQSAIHHGDTAKPTVYGAHSSVSQRSVAPTVTLVVEGSEGDTGESRIYRVASKTTLNRPLYRSHIFYAGTLENLPEHSRSEEGQANVEWEATAVKSNEKPGTQRKPVKCKCRCSVIKNLLDFSLLKSPTFFLLALSGGFSFLGFFVPFMYLTSIATEGDIRANEIRQDDATALIVVIGVSNTLGRVICGFLADRLTRRVLLINNVALTLGGLSTALVPFITMYSLFVIYAFIFGFCIACAVSLRSILVVELMGLNKLTNAIGLILLFQGFASFFGSPLAGILKDLTKNYDTSFYVAGSLMFISGVMCYPLHITNSWEKKRALQKGDSSGQHP